MAKQTEKVAESKVEDLFVRASSNPENIPMVSKFVQTGKRWDSTHKEYIGKLIIVHSYKTIRTRYGDAALVKLDCEGVERMALFGSLVLQEQLLELADNLPILGMIHKPGRAYLLTDPTSAMVEAYQEAYITS